LPAHPQHLGNLCYRFARPCLQHGKCASITSGVVGPSKSSYQLFPLARRQSFAAHDCSPSASTSWTNFMSKNFCIPA
jgi:hypothetical protein